MNLTIIIAKFTLYSYLSQQNKWIIRSVWQPFIRKHIFIIKFKFIQRLHKLVIGHLIFERTTFLNKSLHDCLLHLNIILNIIFYIQTSLQHTFFAIILIWIQCINDRLFPRNAPPTLVIKSPEPVLSGNNNLEVPWSLFIWSFLRSVAVDGLVGLFREKTYGGSVLWWEIC